MTKQMLLAIPIYETRTVIELLWQQAPRTCRAVWDALPMRYPAFHARRSGKELFILPDPLPVREPENATATCRGGDVFFLYLAPTWSDDHPDFNRTEQGLFDIAFIYGDDALLRGPREVLAGNLFGHIVDGLDSFAETCERIWLHGSTEVVLEKL